jgi:hypothetical protein
MEFGDYVKSVVVQEQFDMLNSGSNYDENGKKILRKKDTAVFTLSTDTQEEINRALSDANITYREGMWYIV